MTDTKKIGNLDPQATHFNAHRIKVKNDGRTYSKLALTVGVAIIGTLALTALAIYGNQILTRQAIHVGHAFSNMASGMSKHGVALLAGAVAGILGVATVVAAVAGVCYYLDKRKPPIEITEDTLSDNSIIANIEEEISNEEIDEETQNKMSLATKNSISFFNQQEKAPTLNGKDSLKLWQQTGLPMVKQEYIQYVQEQLTDKQYFLCPVTIDEEKKNLYILKDDIAILPQDKTLKDFHTLKPWQSQ